MRWLVEGADAQTGDNRNFTLDATSQRDAMTKARAKGVLVSNLTPVTPKPGDDGEGTTKPPAAESVQYAEIQSAANIISSVGQFLLAVSVLIGLAGVGLLVFGLSKLGGPPGDDPQGFNLVMLGAAVLIYTVFVVAIGAMLGLMAHTSLAVRDIALNTKK